MLQENVKEYFKVKRTLKELNADLRDAKKNHVMQEELEEVNKKVKQLRKELMSDPIVLDLKDEVDVLKERFSLLKDIIKQEMIDQKTDEVQFEGRKIKIIQVMKEVRDQTVSPKGKGGKPDRSDIEIDENVKVQ